MGRTVIDNLQRSLLGRSNEATAKEKEQSMVIPTHSTPVGTQQTRRTRKGKRVSKAKDNTLNMLKDMDI